MPLHAGETAPASTATTARILGTIPDGTPPPPTAPKPEFIIPQKDVLATTTHQEGGRTITIQQIKPIPLPPPPPPAPQASEADTTAFRQRLAAYHATHPRARTLSLGATVYQSKDSPPRTLVRFWPEGNREPVTFWSAADFSLIAGIHTFVDSSGITRSLHMTWSKLPLDRRAERLATRGHLYQAPEIPQFPAGKATFTLLGDPPDPEILIPIQSLHELYSSEYTRLKTAAGGREQASLQRAAELKAHPPQPHDLTLSYWRTEKPAPAAKGASK